MNTHKLAMLLNKRYPAEFPYQPRFDPYGNVLWRGSGGHSFYDKPFAPYTEPRDFVPLLERFAPDITAFIYYESSYTYPIDKLVEVRIFWQTITPESFCNMLIEMLEKKDE